MKKLRGFNWLYMCLKRAELAVVVYRAYSPFARSLPNKEITDYVAQGVQWGISLGILVLDAWEF